MDDVTFEISPDDIELEQSRCFTVWIPQFAEGDDSSGEATSKVEVLEDDAPLGPAHSLHDDIRRKGAGRFSHWGNKLYFSSSDDTDPRTSGRRYVVAGPRRKGHPPYIPVLRGHEVVPAFMSPSFLPERLVMEMERHPEAQGKSSWGTKNVLQAFVLSLRPTTVLEIGGHIGSASIVIGTALKANNYGVLFTLEPQDHYFRLISKFVKKAGVEDFVRPLQIYSTSPELSVFLPSKVEMIFLDANHSYSAAFHDIQLSDRLLAENGLLFLDDVGPEVSPQIDPEGRGGVRQALLDYTRGRSDLHTIMLGPPLWHNPAGMAMVCKQSV